MPETEGTTFILVDQAWDLDDAHKYRNLGCPHYTDCLSLANTALTRASGRTAKNKKSWRLELRGRTWACSPACQHRWDRSTFHLELMGSPQDPDR